MALMGFSEKEIHILCLVGPNFQGDFFSPTSMLYTNTSSSLRNVLDEDQFVVEDADTYPSTMIPSPVDALALVWDSPHSLAFSLGHSPDWAPCTGYPTVVSLSLCQPVGLRSCFSLSAVLYSTELSPESLGALGTLVC